MPERIPQSVTIRAPLKAYLSDGVTDATGKTIAVTISKNGAAFGNPSAGATNATEIANGWYYVDLSTTDTGSTGPLIVRGTATGCDNSELVYNVTADATTWADTLLKRDMSAVTGEAARSPLNAVRKLMNKVDISGSTLTVRKEDDATAAYTQTIVSDAAQNPIKSLDTV
jgi:hypothetical protein